MLAPLLAVGLRVDHTVSAAKGGIGGRGRAWQMTAERQRREELLPSNTHRELCELVETGRGSHVGPGAGGEEVPWSEPWNFTANVCVASEDSRHIDCR